MTEVGVAFIEQRVRPDNNDAGSQFKQNVLPVNPAGKVPVLIGAFYQAHSASFNIQGQ
jgi:glutathione S-transferase